MCLQNQETKVLLPNILQGKVWHTLPMFKDKPPWVVRKLEWNPLTPTTPAPIGTKFWASLWKKDCRTRRQPLQKQKQKIRRCELITSQETKVVIKRSWEISLLSSCTLSENDVKHSDRILKAVRFFSLESGCNSVHRNLSSVTYLHHELLGLIGPLWSFPVSVIRLVGATVSSVVPAI